MTAMQQCPHGQHHPLPYRADYPHSCDGCWCEGERDRRDYGWPHDTAPKGGAVNCEKLETYVGRSEWAHRNDCVNDSCECPVCNFRVKPEVTDG